MRKILTAVLAFAAIAALTGCTPRSDDYTMASVEDSRFEQVEAGPRYTVYRDRETGVNYLYWTSSGAVCPMFDSEGMVLVDGE